MTITERWLGPGVGDYHLHLPPQARILGLTHQRGTLVLLVLEDELTPPEVPRRFRALRTGAALPAPWAAVYIGSVDLDGGLHVFEVPA